MATLSTPAPIRKLQRALYLRAQQEPRVRAYALYDKVHRPDILAHAYALAKANGGAPGPDGVTCAEIEAAGRDVLLDDLREALHTKMYQPGPVRRVYIPKLNGGERPLGIPNIRDRVVQTAAKLLLEPTGGLARITAAGRHGRSCRGMRSVASVAWSGGTS